MVVVQSNEFEGGVPSRLRFWLGVAGIALLSLGLHFWRLGQFNTLVFDEVYYARFAGHYLLGQQLFGGHPPLSTYIIVLGIWIAQRTPIGDGGIQNGLTGLMLSPVDYRWIDALTGSLLPLLAIALACQLGIVAGVSETRRQCYGLVAGLFFALDGFFLVESRYALINIYMVFLGLLGLWAVLWAMAGKRLWRWRLHSGFLLAGIALGASVAVKWNGLGFMLGLYVLLGLSYMLHGWARWQTGHAGLGRSLVARFASIPLGCGILYWAIVPALTYYLAWIPYIRLNPERNFWQWHAYTLDYHSRIGGPDIHPYCSAWYTWPLMLRPIAYFFKTAHARGEPAPVIGPPLPNSQWAIAYDVHAMGNPFSWWLGTAAIALVLVMVLVGLWQWFFSSSTQPLMLQSSSFGIALFLGVQWAANWLPWLLVSRCVFIYHYMSALAFALLAIAWFVSLWLQSVIPSHRLIGMTIVWIVVVAFVFWVPLYLGIPLSGAELHWRQWIPSWV